MREKGRGGGGMGEGDREKGIEKREAGMEGWRDGGMEG